MKPSRLVAALIFSVALASCAAPNSPAPTPTSDAPSIVPATAPAATASATPTCGEPTAQAALDRWLGDVPQGSEYPWDASNPVGAYYDPCAALSAIPLTIQGGSSGTPYVVMLFHRGEFVQTATREPLVYHPAVVRQADDALAVTYRFAKAGDLLNNPSGAATSVFTWDAAAGKVTRTGELPPGTPEAGPATSDATKAPGTSPGTSHISLPEGAYPKAGGPRPPDATPIKSVRTPKFSYETEHAVFKMKSGNIGCELFVTGEAGCGVKSYAETGQYGEDQLGPRWWISFGNGQPPTIGNKTDAPMYGWGEPKAQVLAYGEVVYYGDVVCASASNGLTCWNTATGRGFFANRAGWKGF